MELIDLLLRCRSYRRFHEAEAVPMAVLEQLVGLARLTASAGNLQPLRYALVCDRAVNAAVFETLGWAAYLKDWSGPAEGERPAAYIVLFGDGRHKKTAAWDLGIAAQTILLGAVEKGLGGVIIGTVDKAKLAGIVTAPEGFEILVVLALGKPKEQVVIEPVGEDGDIRYWRDAAGVHHVPKRALSDLIVGRR